MSKHGKALDKRASADIGWLVRSVTRMVRPIVRLCVGRISCNAFINVVKRVYVEEATRHLERENRGKKVTKSALALLSGLDSRAVDSIMKEDGEVSTPSEIWPEAAILESWASDATYLDPETKKPKILPVYGKGLTFQTLVSRAAGRNVTCQTVLEKLTESKNVRVFNENYVEMLDRRYSAAATAGRNIFEAGTFAISRLADSVSHNLEADKTENKWLQQELWSVKIPCERLEQVRVDLRALLESHIRAAEKMIEPYEDPIKTGRHCAAGLGWYYWESSPD